MVDAYIDGSNNDDDQTAGEYYILFDTLPKNSNIRFRGTSNSCIPAFEFAAKYDAAIPDGFDVIGCLLHNGYPSVSDTIASESRYKRQFPILMALGTDDRLWRQHRVLYIVAWRLEASVSTWVYPTRVV
jgi:hypothetical protein